MVPGDGKECYEISIKRVLSLFCSRGRHIHAVAGHELEHRTKMYFLKCYSVPLYMFL